MNKYFGTVMITIHGWFKADGEEELLDYPLTCASNVTVETEIVDMAEEVDGDEDEEIDEEIDEDDDED